MVEAVLWGLVAGASFVLGGALALWRPPSPAWIAVGAGIGAGALLGAVAYELIDEAGRQAGRHIVVAVGMLGGVALACGFLVGPGGLRRSFTAAGDEVPYAHHRLATLMLSVAAEVVVIVGAFHLHHGVSLAVVVAVFLCGVPEGVVGTAFLIDHGHGGRRVMRSWVALTAYGAVVAAVSYLVIATDRPNLVAAVLSVAGGVVMAAIIAHLAPTAFARLGVLSAFPVVAGFALSVGLVGVG